MNIRRHRTGTLSVMLSFIMATLSPMAMIAAPQTRTQAKRAPVSAQDALLNARVKADPAVKELAAIGRKMVTKVLAADSELDALILAYRNGDNVAAAKWFDMTPTEEAAMKVKFAALSQEIMGRYPEMKGLQKQRAGGSTEEAISLLEGRQAFIESARRLTSHAPLVAAPRNVDVPAGCATEMVGGPFSADTAGLPAAALEDEDPEAGCPWGYYGAALVLCTAMGPVLYWACAAVAYCELCEGPVRDRICNLELVTAPVPARVDTRRRLIPSFFQGY